MEGDEMQPTRAADTAPLFETINVSKAFGAFKALTMFLFTSATANLSPSSIQMGPARPPWSTS
jgi:hypothetical protein